MNRVIEPPMSDEDFAALRERNEKRAKEAIKAMGSKWVGWLAKHEEVVTADSYQQDQIDEHASMQVRGYR